MKLIEKLKEKAQREATLSMVASDTLERVTLTETDQSAKKDRAEENLQWAEYLQQATRLATKTRKSVEHGRAVIADAERVLRRFQVKLSRRIEAANAAEQRLACARANAPRAVVRAFDAERESAK